MRLRQTSYRSGAAIKDPFPAADNVDVGDAIAMLDDSQLRAGIHFLVKVNNACRTQHEHGPKDRCHEKPV